MDNIINAINLIPDVKQNYNGVITIEHIEIIYSNEDNCEYVDRQLEIHENTDFYSEPKIQEIAKEYNISPSIISIKWE